MSRYDSTGDDDATSTTEITPIVDSSRRREQVAKIACSNRGLFIIGLLCMVVIGLVIGQWVDTRRQSAAAADAADRLTACQEAARTPGWFEAFFSNHVAWQIDYLQSGRQQCSPQDAQASINYLTHNAYAWGGLMQSFGAPNMDSTVQFLKTDMQLVKTAIDSSFSCSCVNVYFGACNNASAVNAALAQLQTQSQPWVKFLVDTLHLPAEYPDLQSGWDAHLTCTAAYIDTARRTGIQSNAFAHAIADCMDNALNLGKIIDDVKVNADPIGTSLVRPAFVSA